MVIGAIIGSIALATIIVISIIGYNKSNTIQGDYNTKMQSVVNQINTANYYDQQFDKKHKLQTDSISTDLNDVRNTYQTKIQAEQINKFNEKSITTQELNIANNLKSDKSLTETNKIRFSSEWTGYPDKSLDQSEISNDTTNFKQLMIVGNKSFDINGPRSVGIWDKLDVHGNLNVDNNTKTNKLQLGDKFSLSGVGEAHGNDTWLRLFNKDGTDYNGGIAAANTWSRDNSYMNNSHANTTNTTKLNTTKANINKLGVGADIPDDWRSANFLRSDGKWSHLDWVGDGKNYLRGDTVIDGDTNINGNTNINGTTILNGNKFLANAGSNGWWNNITQKDDLVIGNSKDNLNGNNAPINGITIAPWNGIGGMRVHGGGVNINGKIDAQGNSTNDWNYRQLNANGGNVHMNHGDGYGMHINTNNQEASKYGLQLYNGQREVLGVYNDGRINAPSKLTINDGNDSGANRGINLWHQGDPRFGIWMSTPGAGKGLNGGNVPDGGISHHSVRFSTGNWGGHGFVFQNSDGKPLMSIKGDDGRTNVYGTLNVDNAQNLCIGDVCLNKSQLQAIKTKVGI